MNRRVVVRGLLWLLGTGCLFLPVLDDPPLQTGAYVQDVRADSAVVAMITAAPCVLRLHVSDHAGNEVEVADAVATRRHALRATGLRSGRSHEFTVERNGGGTLDRGSFRTPPDDDRMPVYFDVLGDSGAEPWWVWLQTSPLFYLPARWNWLPPHGRVTRMGVQILEDAPDFVLHVGDIVYPWGRACHYSAGFFRPFAEVLRRAPCYVALGNHDTLDDDGRQALANFVLPTNEVTGDERMYSIAWGPVRVIVLDLNEEGHDRVKLYPVDANHPTIRFLRGELERATEPWLVVASHFPIESASRQGDRDDLIEYVLPLLRDFGVNLYLSGHDHTYQRLRKDGDPPLVVTGGGGKSLYEIGGHADKIVGLSKYNHCMVKVNGRDLTLFAIGLDGQQLDRLDLHQDKAAAELVRDKNAGRARRIEKLLK